MALSSAAKRERETVQVMRDCTDKLLHVQGQFRMDSAANQYAGQLSAAMLIIEHVADKIEDRTWED